MRAVSAISPLKFISSEFVSNLRVSRPAVSSLAAKSFNASTAWSFRQFHSSEPGEKNDSTNRNEEQRQRGHSDQHHRQSNRTFREFWKKWRSVTALAGAAPAPFMAAAVITSVSKESEQSDHHEAANDRSGFDARTGLPIIMHGEVFAPNVPPPLDRRSPAVVRVKLRSEVTDIQVSPKYKYRGWSFNGKIPGPFIRVRVGDTLEVTHENLDTTGMAHNVDFHAVMGSGGGAPLLTADSETERTARFKMLYPGLFIYHCAAGPLPMHVANGMYGLVLVEPEEGLSKVDKEFYVMQSEFYVDQSTIKDEGYASFDYEAGLKEQPELVVFNGKDGSLTHGNVLNARLNDKCRIFFGNSGPNLLSTFHVIGAIFEKVYRDGSVVDTPSRFTQNVLVGPGSAAVVEFTPQVPGNYTLVDHALFRTDKGAVGFLNVKGPQQPHIYSATHTPTPCPNCKIHP